MAIIVGRAVLAEIDLVIAQGADNTFSFRYSKDIEGTRMPVDLTGHTARSQIRGSVGGELFLELAPTLTSTGLIEISILAATTETPEWDKRRGGVWDMELIDPAGGVIRFCSGSVKFVPDVTRSE